MANVSSRPAIGVPLAAIPAGPDLFRDWRVDPEPPTEALSASSLVNCLYAGFSGAQSLDANRQRILQLCAPSARVFITQRALTGVARPREMTMPEYLDNLQSRFPDGDLFAVELARVTRELGAVGHVLTFWRSMRSDRSTVVARGMTSLQLFNDGRRWWLLSYFSDTVATEEELLALVRPYSS